MVSALINEKSAKDLSLISLSNDTVKSDWTVYQPMLKGDWTVCQRMLKSDWTVCQPVLIGDWTVCQPMLKVDLSQPMLKGD